MAKLIGRKAMNKVVAHLPVVRNGVHKEAKDIGRKAKALLAEARASTHWRKIHPESSPPHVTRIEVTQGAVDSYVQMWGLNPMATEFGHAPSGVFGPDGELGHLQSRAPHGLYILTRAAGLAMKTMVPAPTRKRGKR